MTKLSISRVHVSTSAESSCCHLVIVRQLTHWLFRTECFSDCLHHACVATEKKVSLTNTAPWAVRLVGFLRAAMQDNSKIWTCRGRSSESSPPWQLLSLQDDSTDDLKTVKRLQDKQALLKNHRQTWDRQYISIAPTILYRANLTLLPRCQLWNTMTSGQHVRTPKTYFRRAPLSS